MSINSMASAAMARRSDFGPAGVPEDLAGIAAAVASYARPPSPPAQPGGRAMLVAPAQPTGGRIVESAPGGAAGNVSSALQVITTYIPTETVTLYVAFLAALRNAQTQRVDPSSALFVFCFFVVATPLFVWLVYAARLKTSGGGRKLPLHPDTWPVWEMFAATTAYAAWAFALPDSPFAGHVAPAIGGVLVLVTSTVLGLAAPIFQRPLKA
jgi:hypothetical protein